MKVYLPILNVGMRGAPPNLAFQMLIDTSLGDAASTMAIPTFGTDAYDCSVDWGDGVTTTHSGTTPTISHSYASGGTYNISITGTFPRIYFNNTGDKLKLTSVVNWGKYGEGIVDQSNAFYGCTNNTSIAEDWDLIDASITNGNYMFAANALTYLPSGMTLATLTDGYAMFWGSALTELPTGMELPLLNDSAYMFSSNDLTYLPSGMTLAALTDGTSMFRDNDLTYLPSGMTLPLLTNGQIMFYNNPLTTLPSGMELPLLTDGAYMFQHSPLTSLPSGITLSLLTNGTLMFAASTINTTDYSAFIVRMEAANSNTGVPFHGGNSEYTGAAAIAAHAALLARDPAWTITDGGEV